MKVDFNYISARTEMHILLLATTVVQLSHQNRNAYFEAEEEFSRKVLLSFVAIKGHSDGLFLNLFL